MKELKHGVPFSLPSLGGCHRRDWVTPPLIHIILFVLPQRGSKKTYGGFRKFGVPFLGVPVRGFHSLWGTTGVPYFGKCPRVGKPTARGSCAGNFVLEQVVASTWKRDRSHHVTILRCPSSHLRRSAYLLALSCHALRPTPCSFGSTHMVLLHVSQRSDDERKQGFAIGRLLRDWRPVLHRFRVVGAVSTVSAHVAEDRVAPISLGISKNPRP